MTLPALRSIVLTFAALLAIAICANAQAAGRTTIHVIKGGETLQSISQRYYGTTRRWTQIYEQNRDVLRAPSQVEKGMRLRITGLPAVARASLPNSSTPTPTPTHNAPTTASLDDGIIEIQASDTDTVESIAQRYMGSPKFWRSVLALNPRVLKSPDDLKPGMRLRVQALLPRSPDADRSPASSRKTRTLERYSAIDEAHPDRAASAPASPIVADEIVPVDGSPVVVPAPAAVSAGETRAARIGTLRFDDFLDP